MSKRSRPTKNHVSALKPHNHKAKPGLIDPELARQYEELLLLREKLKMATSRSHSKTRSGLLMGADRTSFAASSMGALDPRQTARSQSAIGMAPDKRMRSQKFLTRWF